MYLFSNQCFSFSFTLSQIWSDHVVLYLKMYSGDPMTSYVSYEYMWAYSFFQERRKMTWTWFSKFKSHWAKTFWLNDLIAGVHSVLLQRPDAHSGVCFRSTLLQGLQWGGSSEGNLQVAFLVMAEIWKRIFFSWREENKWTVLYHIMVYYTTVTMNSSYVHVHKHQYNEPQKQCDMTTEECIHCDDDFMKFKYLVCFRSTCIYVGKILKYIKYRVNVIFMFL